MNAPATDPRVAAYRDVYANPPFADEYHRTLGLRFTEGVSLAASALGAYWLVDLVASHQPRVRRRLRSLGLRDFQVWTVERLGAGVVVHAWSDTPGAEGSFPLVRQNVAYSDFPAELLPFADLWVENGVLLLKTER